MDKHIHFEHIKNHIDHLNVYESTAKRMKTISFHQQNISWQNLSSMFTVNTESRFAKNLNKECLLTKSKTI